MAADRPLPSRKNPLLQPGSTPQHEILEERRCHAQTKLAVAPGQVNTSNATKAENLIEKFDYVHLRAPLPKDLTGSGVFAANSSQPVPESYFLMRRSSDGYVSATGMFKAGFPWATRQEEHAEREHIKSLPGTDQQEIAGNLWVLPEIAVELAEEYGIAAWIEALLSNEPVELYSVAGGPKKITTDPKPIASPPPFTMPPKASSQTGTTRKRRTEPRSASPAEAATAPTPSRPKKTPRKPRVPRKTAASAPVEDATPSIADSVADSADEHEVEVEAEEATETANAEEDADSDAVAQAKELLDAAEDDDVTATILPNNSVRLSLEEEVKDDGQTQTTHTTVKVELPASSPDLELPRDTDGVVEMAREIVENVRDMQRSKIEADAAAAAAAESPSPPPKKAQKSSPRKSMKRSRDEFEEDLFEGPEELVEELVEAVLAERADGVQSRPVKRVRLMVPAEDFRREKVLKRALIGLSASLAVGLLIPAISTYWGA